jgi:hypothetical protein
MKRERAKLSLCFQAPYCEDIWEVKVKLHTFLTCALYKSERCALCLAPLYIRMCHSLVIALLLEILKVLGFNLGSEIGYHDRFHDPPPS